MAFALDKVREIAERVAQSSGLILWDIELKGSGASRTLRIFIDKPEGVSHADCELISQRVGDALDAEDVVPGEGYTLEVSSPGIERKLTKPRDFERFVGQRAKFLLREPVENQRRWEGTLAGFSEGVVSLEPSAGRLIQIPLAQVEKANLKFHW